MPNWFSHPWTLWTAPLVHLSVAHALANCFALAALLGMAALGGGKPLLLRYLIGLLIAWPLSTLSLMLCPQVSYYVGLSGLVHAGVALLGVFLLQGSRYLGLTLLLGLAVKLWQEQAWVQPVVWSADWGFHVVVVAHLYGAVVGLVVGAVAVLVAPTYVQECSYAARIRLTSAVVE
jgi:rhomboid family GlyGly-CTERM serine protease